jgi:Flp pilus assembly protein TadG
MKSTRTRVGGTSDSGASALEFAIVAPVLILLLAGMIEFGFVFQAQLALTHAAREGARMAAVGLYDSATVVERAFPITPAISTNPNPPSSATSGQPIVVTLTHDYDYQILPFPGSLPLTGQATMRRE